MPTSITTIPTAVDIRESHTLIQGLIHRTPVLTCESIDLIAGAQCFFKCENFQKIGAFKMRGAANAARRLTPEQMAKGITTHSSGNHAQAIARAAKVLGIQATIVMPENSPAVKIAATRGYGATIVLCGPRPIDREEMLEKVVAETGATFVHPFDNYNVIAGQATAALELIEDSPALDAIIAPVGGGGLMSGTALSTHYFSPNTEIWGAEPEEVNDAYLSFTSGERKENKTTNTIADGLKTNLSEKTFEIISTHLKGVLTVSEEEILAALRLVWERMKIVIEPSCAVPLAAVLKNPELFQGKKVGIILTGGNVDITLAQV
jgi:threonine dehydratase